jgi:hypothetical protein
MKVKKGTCPNYDNNRNASVTYNEESVWLPSEREMGLNSYSPLSVANSSTTKSECTEGKDFAYSYYTNATSRIKYAMEANGTLTTTAKYYWERSRYYFSSNTNGVCFVNSYGIADYYTYNGSYGLAPAFVIG